MARPPKPWPHGPHAHWTYYTWQWEREGDRIFLMGGNPWRRLWYWDVI